MAFLGDVTLDSSTDTNLEKNVSLSDVEFIDNGDVTLSDSDDNLVEMSSIHWSTSSLHQAYRHLRTSSKCIA